MCITYPRDQSLRGFNNDAGLNSFRAERTSFMKYSVQSYNSLLVTKSQLIFANISYDCV